MPLLYQFLARELGVGGPGATNFVTAAAYAQLGGMPMLMITGQKPVKTSKQGQFQILSAVMTTVLVSVFAHGLTAVPGTKWYAQYTERADLAAAEHEQVEEMPVRLPYVLDRKSDQVPTANLK